MIIFWKLVRLCLLASFLMGPLISSAWVFAQEDKVDLSLRLLSGYYYKEVTPGSTTTLFMEVRNNGNTAITNIRLTAAKPEGWVVDFKPGSISYLSAGSSQTVDIDVTPHQNTVRGEYALTLLAEANETRTATSTILRVEDGFSLWLWVGIGVAALAIAGFIFIFLRFGRQ